jgi:two-component system response regulator
MNQLTTMRISGLAEYTVLLVTDNPDDRARVVLAFMRAARNVRLSVTEDSRQMGDYLSGMSLYSDRDAYPIPQLILLDLDLPHQSGFDALEWLRTEPRFSAIPVIVLTASRQASDIDGAYALGASSCLLKSVDEDAMQDIARGIGDYAELLNAGLVGDYENASASDRSRFVSRVTSPISVPANS